MSLATKIEQFGVDADLAHRVVHGGPTVTVTTEGGPVPSLAKTMSGLEIAAIATSNATLAAMDARVNDAADAVLEALNSSVNIAADGVLAGAVSAAASTALDADQTALDRIATGADREDVALDLASADSAKDTAVSAASSAALDADQTALDRIATGADRSAVALDLTAANSAKDTAVAGGSLATSKAADALASAAAALASEGAAAATLAGAVKTVDLVAGSGSSLVGTSTGTVDSDLKALAIPTLAKAGGEKLRNILAILNSQSGKKVTWVGDSIIEQGKPGIGSGAGLGVGFTTFVEQAYPNIAYSNQGIGGETTIDVIARISTITATAAHLYVVAIGVNDARYNDSRGATTQAAYIANITNIVNALVAAGGQVVVISIWPTFWKDQFSALGRKKTDDRVRQWNAALSSYCALSALIPFVDAHTAISRAIDFSNSNDMVPDGVHPDGATTTAKKMYAAAVLRGSIDKAEFHSWFIPTGTVGYKLRVFDNGQADHLLSIKNLKIAPYYKEWFAQSANASIGVTGLFGSYSGAYAGYKNKISDFPIDFIVTTDQFASGFTTVSAGVASGVRSYELYMSTDPRAFSDPHHESWRMIEHEYSNLAVAYELMPKKREGVFYRLSVADSNGTDGTGGTSGTYVKIAKIWGGVNPVRFATSNFIAASTGPYERCDIVFSAAGGDSSSQFANVANTWPLDIMWESPQRVPTITIASVAEAGRVIKNWVLYRSYDPLCINDTAHSSWASIATGVGDQTITVP